MQANAEARLAYKMKIAALCSTNTLDRLYPFIGVICLTSTVPLAWWWGASHHLDLLAIMFTSSDEEHEGRFGFQNFALDCYRSLSC